MYNKNINLIFYKYLLNKDGVKPFPEIFYFFSHFEPQLLHSR
jgi:hypothetical protein